MERKVLKEEYQAISDEFEYRYSDRGCTCFLNPPCSYCTHPGNPLNLDETDEAWEPAIRQLTTTEKESK